MAADGWATTNHMHYPIMFPKIGGGPGGLIGISGSSRDCYRVLQWFANGEIDDSIYRPRDLKTGEDGISALILRPDGSVWQMDETLAAYPCENPATVGYSSACAFTEGAMWAGLSAEAAVRLAIEHCTHVGGNVQVESIGAVERIGAAPDGLMKGAPKWPLWGPGPSA
jgi:hypothetical protein